MLYFSTKNQAHLVSAKTAVLEGLAPDGGLYLPVEVPALPTNILKSIHRLSREELSFHILAPYFSKDVSAYVFRKMIEEWSKLPTSVVQFDDRSILELFHGPTQAFKDFGARWTALLLEEYQRLENRKLQILVATSGDTGGAVGSAFHGKEGIDVTILYPEGRVSPEQENQMKSFGGNVETIAIPGSFDDCQELVKRAFLDLELRKVCRLSSANSINIGRWIPQSVYYFIGYRECHQYPTLATFGVPCGNLGNLSAGLLAQTMGLPVEQWIASTNENDAFIRYLSGDDGEQYYPIPTLANAMDVGHPNNLERIIPFQCSTWNNISPNIIGYRIMDRMIRETIESVREQFEYRLDPHTATIWQAVSMWLTHTKTKRDKPILVATAHADKFKSIMTSTSSPTMAKLGMNTLTPKEKNVQYSRLYEHILSKD